jgi:PAS domain S-box-containing protein
MVLAAAALLGSTAWGVHLRRLAAERVVHQRNILESEERLHFALEGAGYGVWDWNIQTGKVLYSGLWKRMHGYADNDLLDTLEGWERFVHPDDVEPTRRAMLDYFEGKTAQFAHEYRLRGKDGDWKWVMDRGMIAARDAKGKPLRMICTHADITERKLTEDRLRQLNENLETKVEERTRELSQAMEQVVEAQKLASLGSMVAGISHELNTPLGNILMVASTLNDKLDGLHELIQEGKLSRHALYTLMDESRRAGDMILRSANRSVELIESFKRVAVDQTSQRRREFDLEATVQDTLNAFGPSLRRANVSVDVQVEPAIEMDSFPGHLEQILNNLISNSLLHGFEGRNSGHIAISAAQKGDAVELVYQDDGNGVPREMQHRVFEPFYTTKLGQGGSGLGLSIVHNLTQAIFRGRLKLESEPGHGVRFVFWLPLVTPEPARASATPGA